MIGGTAYVAGRAGQRSAQRQQDEEYREQDQDAQLAELQAQNQQLLAQQAAPPAGGPTDLAAKLTELKSLADQGVLTQEEFDSAKKKLLSGL